MARRRRAGPKIAARNLRRTADHSIDHLFEDPVFRVLTVDTLSWINPYTGDLVDAPFDYREAARAVLRRDQPWQHSRPMTLSQLQVLRWSHHLRGYVREEPRLRFFHPGGEWLNPFTGAWVGGVHRIDGKIAATTIEQMARILATCQAAATGGEMLPTRQLRLIYGETLAAERAVGERLQHTRSAGSRRIPSPREGVPAPSYQAQPTPLGTGALEPFGWSELFGSDSPFDDTPVRNRASEEVVDAHQLLAQAGIDWALHPGFAADSRGYHAGLYPTADEQVLIVIGRVLGGGEEHVRRLRTELRYIAQQHTGFARLVEAIATYAYHELGSDHQLQCLLGLCDPVGRTLGWLACGCDPAVIATGHQLDSILPVGGDAPLMGVDPWDVFSLAMEPSLMQLDQGTVFAAHQDIYRVAAADGHQIGHQALWQVVAQLSGERPRELLTRIMGRLYRHSGELVKDALPQVGMIAMRLKDRSAAVPTI